MKKKTRQETEEKNGGNRRMRKREGWKDIPLLDAPPAAPPADAPRDAPPLLLTPEIRDEIRDKENRTPPAVRSSDGTAIPSSLSSW